MTNQTHDTVPNDAPGTKDPGVFRFKRTHVYSILLPLAFVAGLASGFIFWGRDAAQPVQPTQPAQPADPQNDRAEVGIGDDPSIGPTDAPVTIIEFADFNCGFCARFHAEIFPMLLAEFQDNILFVYRDFPVVGGGAVGAAAAHAANCAGEQDAYWEYHDALYSGMYSMNDDGFAMYAEDLNLDLEAFDACQESNRYADEVLEDYTDARAVNVSGTPTFFINGRRVIGAQPFAVFAQIINEELDS
jgi:protein-disulfide isomerase